MKRNKVKHYSEAFLAKKKHSLLKQNYQIVRNDGTINTEHLKRALKDLDSIEDYAQRKQMKKDFKESVKISMQNNAQLRFRDFVNAYEDDSRKRMFLNAGLTTEEVARSIGVAETELLDDKNWKKSNGNWQFNFAGKSYGFKFDYYGDVLTQINA